MSATRETLQPSDNAELLRMSERVARFAPEDNRNAWEEAKRDLVLCMERGTLLLALGDGTPLARSGPEGRVLIAFTDNEAAQAWAGDQRPEAPAPEFGLTSDAPPKSERDGRKLWLAWFEQLTAVAVVVNPAGPLGFVAHHYECRNMRPRLRRRRSEETEEAWLDLSARGAERGRVAELMRALTTAIAAGDESAVERLRPELGEVNRFGSLATAAQNQLLTGRWRLRAGERKAGITQLMFGALSWGRFGDPWRSIDGLLEGGEILLQMQERGVDAADEPRWIEPSLADLAGVLERMTIGYREADAARFARWRASPAGGQG
jgi:hypothetical protein